MQTKADLIKRVRAAESRLGRQQMETYYPLLNQKDPIAIIGRLEADKILLQEQVDRADKKFGQLCLDVGRLCLEVREIRVDTLTPTLTRVESCELELEAIRKQLSIITTRLNIITKELRPPSRKRAWDWLVKLIHRTRS